MTCSSLEGNNLEVSVITQSCRVSFGSPDTRVATLCWLNSLKRRHRVSAQTRLITESLMIVADQCIVRCRWLCGTGLRQVRRRSGRAGIWYFCGNNILFIIFITIIICSHARCKRSRISIREKNSIFCCSVSSASCLLLIVILAFDVLKFLTFLVFWKCLLLFQ